MRARTQQVLAFVFGITFITILLIIAVLFPTPTPFQYTVFRIVLSLAAAGVAAMIPGFIHVNINDWLRAGGALAVFVLVYLYNPAKLVSPDPISPQNLSETVVFFEDKDGKRMFEKELWVKFYASRLTMIRIMAR